jgi:hypothetical protein
MQRRGLEKGGAHRVTLGREHSPVALLLVEFGIHHLKALLQVSTCGEKQEQLDVKGSST